ncbi:MAG: SPOR domain-containing protein [Gammaproteobacteria bacterium]|nr:SPOR domain-containing protein [Gammaproteobacteria bacterium]
MTQDFAKIKPEPILEKRAVESPPAWLLMVTGSLIGATAGVFACVLFYLSGNVPPLNIVQQPQSVVSESASKKFLEETSAPGLELEFYTELSKYEVQTDAIPVELTSLIPAEIAEGISTELINANNKQSFMLQTGAFQQQASAESEMQRQRELGLNVIVKLAELPGKKLHLVQAGPYSSGSDLESARQILRKNNIEPLTVQLQ